MIDAPTSSLGNGSGPANNRESTGRFSPGHSGNPAGRQKGVANKATLSIREFSRSVLENPKYRAHLMRGAEEDKLAPHEFLMLHQYAYGKPKDTVAIEDQRRAPNPDRVLERPWRPAGASPPAQAQSPGAAASAGRDRLHARGL
jgi:hypothetical protein